MEFLYTSCSSFLEMGKGACLGGRGVFLLVLERVHTYVYLGSDEMKA